MMWKKVLDSVDRQLAQELTRMLIGKGWTAAHQTSYPVVDVMVRTDIDEQVANIRSILETHIIRGGVKRTASEIKDREGLAKALPTPKLNAKRPNVEDPRARERGGMAMPNMRAKGPFLPEIDEAFEELQGNPLLAARIFGKNAKGKETFYVRSRRGQHTIGFFKPNGKKRVKFWIVGRRAS